MVVAKDTPLNKPLNGRVVYTNGDVCYFKNGKMHREDGPAIEWKDGDIDWRYYGISARSEKEFYDERWRKEALLDLV